MDVWFLPLVLLCLTESTQTTAMDFGGVPLWINRLLGEPSVMSLQGRMDSAWLRANNPQPCPQQCDCPIHWPTALYCDNRVLTHVPDQLPERTEYIFMQGNNISSLSSSALVNMTGLRWLILDNNKLQNDKLDKDALQNLTHLCYLFANHNHLTSIPGGLPSGLKQLRLAHNRISSISPGALQNLSNLTLLLLHGNKLKTLPEGELRGLLRLNLLDLSDNSFSTVPGRLPPSVQQLYLSNNSLAALTEDNFQGLFNLKYLRLSHCGLQSHNIHHQAFNFTSLIELDLSYNRLMTIPTVPTSLQYLYLEANAIQDINMTSFCREVGPLSFSWMRILRLDGNKLSPQHLPRDWAFCLRVIQTLLI
ncbi:lumican isoform X1 [Synchiropus splendidus]|uniref:lumican isoform X1 n=2 Tax=Synchiropus splendidus TaxID=270530 RepID=UPI00237D8BC2|nr:lumican isoform X1 [Synchiropus splendidus]